jgi:hypothetical protein
VIDRREITVVDMNETEGASSDPIKRRLEKILGEVEMEKKEQGKASHKYSRQATWLSIAGAVGSTLAGGVVAANQNLQGELRTLVLILAFLGAVINAAAAAVRAPQRAEGARSRWIALRALARRLEAVLAVEFNGGSQVDARRFLDSTLDWLDEIQGAKVPNELRLGSKTSRE